MSNLAVFPCIREIAFFLLRSFNFVSGVVSYGKIVFYMESYTYCFLFWFKAKYHLWILPEYWLGTYSWGLASYSYGRK